MNIPEHWYRVTFDPANPHGELASVAPEKHSDLPIIAYGWSFESLDAAEADAWERLRRIREALIAGDPPGRYPYSDGAIREEILERMDCNGELIGMITRNRYGALVLNSKSIMFVDIDAPTPAVNRFGCLVSLFLSKRAREERERVWLEKAQALEAETLDNIHSWCRANPRYSVRLYKTFAGFRLLFTDTQHDPVSSRTTEIMQNLAADPLYITLTRGQNCFRARLTPKPWRCQFSCPPVDCKFPREDQAANQMFESWLEDYDQRAAQFRTCAFLAALGPGEVSEEAQRIIDLHDTQCRISSEAALA